MKPGKSHDLTSEEVGRGFSRTQEVKDKDPSDDYDAKMMAEYFDEPEGFLERQNTYERI